MMDPMAPMMDPMAPMMDPMAPMMDPMESMMDPMDVQQTSHGPNFHGNSFPMGFLLGVETPNPFQGKTLFFS